MSFLSVRCYAEAKYNAVITAAEAITLAAAEALAVAEMTVALAAMEIAAMETADSLVLSTEG